MHPTAQPSLDRDLAIFLITAPVWITGFLVLVVAGAVRDWRVRRG